VEALLANMESLAGNDDDCFVGCDVSPCLFEMVCRVRGMEETIFDLAGRPDLARHQLDRAAAFALRALTFRGALDDDQDAFDSACQHVIVEEAESGRVICTFRLLLMADGSQIGGSYSAQFYELSALESFEGPMLELGRFCIHPEVQDPDVLRVAWAKMTEIVDETGVQLMFGCSSFMGTEAENYYDAFALLKERHLAPGRWLPKVKAPRVFRFASKLRLRKPNLKLAMKGMPPLLRTYLVMGGWVSDHAVVDRDLGTLHVFTGLEVKAIPPARKRLLGALAG
jgi:putative hemolysin